MYEPILLYRRVMQARVTRSWWLFLYAFCSLGRIPRIGCIVCRIYSIVFEFSDLVLPKSFLLFSTFSLDFVNFRTLGLQTVIVFFHKATVVYVCVYVCVNVCLYVCECVVYRCVSLCENWPMHYIGIRISRYKTIIYRSLMYNENEF